MKKSAARIACLLLLAISILGMHRALMTRADLDIAASVNALIREHGLALRDNPVKPPLIRSAAIYFQRPECRDASVVIPFDLNQATLPYLMGVIKPGFDHRFVYLDRSWKEQDTVSMLGAFVQHRVLGMLGASPYLPYRMALVVAEPADCRAAPPIDWRLVWDSNRHRAGKS